MDGDLRTTASDETNAYLLGMSNEIDKIQGEENEDTKLRLYVLLLQLVKKL